MSRPGGSLGGRPGWTADRAPPRVGPGCVVTVGSRSVRQDEIGEAEYLAVNRQVLAFAGVDPVPDLGGPGVAWAGEQPFLPARAEGRLVITGTHTDASACLGHVRRLPGRRR